MANKRINQFDEETGEILGGFVAYIAPKRTNGFDRWLAMAQNPLVLLALSDLDKADHKVLLMLMAKIDFENLIVLNQAELGRELEMHRQQVQRSIKRLIKMGVLLEGQKVGTSRSYRLNPNYGWKGSAKNHVVALDAERKERMKKANISGVVEQERDEKTRDWVEEVEAT
ncbi:MAG: helix-turn-helix domain-containing protein [Methylococcales bacterium]|nr:helix-turn-helix domain-containing protein [Methylococcales bacterium]MDP3333650.1 helix-turn-helix domain-containing protein [Methylococcaceae bacterium]MDP3840927.1 helix-turn-helix domain-containing protein [Methylococcales bacterium]